jgi:hypothetical protein
LRLVEERRRGGEEERGEVGNVNVTESAVSSAHVT